MTIVRHSLIWLLISLHIEPGCRTQIMGNRLPFWLTNQAGGQTYQNSPYDPSKYMNPMVIPYASAGYKLQLSELPNWDKPMSHHQMLEYNRYSQSSIPGATLLSSPMVRFTEYVEKNPNDWTYLG